MFLADDLEPKVTVDGFLPCDEQSTATGKEESGTEIRSLPFMLDPH